MNSPPTPEGPGSVSGAPDLPAGFTGTFTSRYIDTGVLRQPVVTGGEGPPPLLVNGWPTMKLAADDVQALVIPGCAHWVAEETPEETLAALTTFLAL